MGGNLQAFTHFCEQMKCYSSTHVQCVWAHVCLFVWSPSLLPEGWFKQGEVQDMEMGWWGSNQQQKCIPFNDQPPLNLFSDEGAKGGSKIWRADCWWKQLFLGVIAQPIQIFFAIFFNYMILKGFISQTMQVWKCSNLEMICRSDTCQNI